MTFWPEVWEPCILQGKTYYSGEHLKHIWHTYNFVKVQHSKIHYSGKKCNLQKVQHVITRMKYVKICCQAELIKRFSKI